MVVNLRFTEAARGVNKDLNVNIVDTCTKCGGTRCEPGTKAIKCTYCNGTGMETFSRGMFMIEFLSTFLVPLMQNMYNV